jgi:TolB-like protein/tetratricopeptide (TPR) repeat protein
MPVFGELKRRNVFRVGFAYIVTAWLVLQLVDVVGPILEVPDWVAKAILLLLVVGFPLALLFAWAFELTPEGLKFERDVDPAQSVTRSTGRKLNYVIIGILFVAVIFFALDKFIWSAPVEEADTRRSIAVLPFANMSGDPEQVYFSDGITEEILNALVRVPGISVASRTSSFNYRGEVPAVSTIAAELGVLFVLEGSVRKAGDSVRITAQLIDGVTDRHLWSETYDRELEDIFEIQSDIATRIARAIQGEMGATADASVPAKVLTANMSAYDLFLKGRAAFNERLVLADIDESIEFLEQAIELDPSFAIAWQYRAAAYAARPFYSGDIANFDQEIATSTQAAERALALDPTLAFAHAIIAGNKALMPPCDLVEVLEQYDIALEKDPNDMTTLYWRGLQLAMAGYLDEALEVMYQCLDIDPLYRNCLIQTGDISLLLGDVETYNTVYATLAERFAMELAAMQVPLELTAGNRTMAVIVAAHASGLHGSPFQLWLDALEKPDADHSRAWEEYRAWAESAGTDLRAYPEVLAAFGQYDQIDLKILANTFHWIPHFAPYRASASFKQQMRKYGYLKFWQAKGFPAMCRPVGTDDFECD